MMIFGLLLELLLFVGVYLQKGDADDCNVIFQSKLNATMECFKTYRECFFDNLQARFPKLYNKTGWKREPPRDEAIKPSSFCEPDSKGVNQSGLHVYWKMPDSYNAGGIAGYEFHLELDPPNFRCLVVILHEKPTQFNRHFSLNITMFPVKRNQNYMIVLHSLPRANDSISSHKKVTSMNCKRGSSSADWTPAEYNDSYKWPEKILTIWFPPPPLEFNITRFQLDLLRTDILLTDSKPTTLTSNTTEVSFANQEPGNYTLYMRPYNEHPHDEDRCVCRDDENICKPCQLTYWEIIIGKV
ncbi:uncharacterized protein LOC132735211 [Ruditapes philippinarum]|uniref:uncharacterized protein LOC132735211 n=1 Tax=Ruditapes philippinarum TaxID=129788 RepID=UPI00295B3BC6|nr:uncharacterized protein LOC132735211 [Ruditapes philippinarum]